MVLFQISIKLIQKFFSAFYDNQEYHKNNKVLQNVNKKLDSIFNEMKTRKIIKGDK